VWVQDSAHSTHTRVDTTDRITGCRLAPTATWTGFNANDIISVRGINYCLQYPRMQYSSSSVKPYRNVRLDVPQQLCQTTSVRQKDDYIAVFSPTSSGGSRYTCEHGECAQDRSRRRRGTPSLPAPLVFTTCLEEGCSLPCNGLLCQRRLHDVCHRASCAALAVWGSLADSFGRYRNQRDS
jgi:hypothetical protein